MPRADDRQERIEGAVDQFGVVGDELQLLHVELVPDMGLQLGRNGRLGCQGHGGGRGQPNPQPAQWLPGADLAGGARGTAQPHDAPGKRD